MKSKKLLLHYVLYGFVPVVYASLRALFSKHTLPPGQFVAVNYVERSDQLFLLSRSKQIGPISKAIIGKHFGVCIVGLPLCQRFLQEHDSILTAVTMDFEKLFPKGFLRKMRGEEHRAYRRSLNRAISPGFVDADKEVFETLVIEQLKAYQAIQAEDDEAAQRYIKTLSATTSSILIYLFFGATPGSEPFARLLAMYTQLGPNGLEWFIGKRQRDAFYEIRRYLLKQLEALDQGGSQWIGTSIIGRMHADGALDETSLGNLIYMVEMGRFDMYCLFRWLTKYGAENPVLLERIGTESPCASGEDKSLSEAFVLETLRLNQSERLMRLVSRDIIFEGYLIPKHSLVRLCLWESHKSSDAFPEPLVFDPERFRTQIIRKDQFSPFGMGHHNCPLSNIVTSMGAIFIRTLARHHSLEAIANGPVERGDFHWRPARGFSVLLRPLRRHP